MLAYLIVIKRLRYALNKGFAELSIFKKIEIYNSLKLVLEETNQSISVFETMILHENDKLIDESWFMQKLNKCKEDFFKKIEEIGFSSISSWETQLISTIFESIREAFDSSDQLLNLECLKEEAKDEIFNKVLKEFENALHDSKVTRPSCFISYAWGNSSNERYVYKMAKKLKEAGIEVILDLWNDGNDSVIQFSQRILKADFVLIFGSQLLKQKYENTKLGYLVKEELDLISIRIKERPTQHRVIKVLIEQPIESAFPNFLHTYPAINLSNQLDYYNEFWSLLDLLYTTTINNDVLNVLNTKKDEFTKINIELEKLNLIELQKYIVNHSIFEPQNILQSKSDSKKISLSLSDSALAITSPAVVTSLEVSPSERKSISIKEQNLHNIMEVTTKVTALLRQRYTTPAYAELKRLFLERSFSINDCFIDLTIVKEHEQKLKDQQLKAIELLSRDNCIYAFEEIYQSKAPLEIDALFRMQDDKTQAPKRLLIEGRAGIGKTTLCQYFAHQWAIGKNKLQAWQEQFAWVIHLPLRQLTADPQKDFSKLTLDHWLYKQYLFSTDQQQITASEFADTLHALDAQGKFLLLLDGYDEIVPVLKSNSSFQSFFDQELLSCTYWLVFSRPYYFTDNRVELRLENVGFTNQNISRYVQQYFKDVEKEKHISQQACAESLDIYLKYNSKVMGIAHIPLNLELLCNVWESGTNQLTLTELYAHLVLSSFGRYLHKFYPKAISSASDITWEDLQTDTEYRSLQMLAFLEELAWHQIQKSSLIISADIIKKLMRNFYPGLKQQLQREAFGEEVLKQLGLLKGYDIHKPALDQSYYFIHLTFQEYFAARHIVTCWKENRSLAGEISIPGLIAREKLNPRYEIIWWMVAGLLKEDKILLEAFFDCLQQQPPDNLVQLNQQLLQMRCLEECQLSISESRKNKLIAELIQCINYEIMAGEKYKRDFITIYLGMSPQVFQQLVIQGVASSSKDKKKVLNSLNILTRQPNFSFEQLQKLTMLLSNEYDEVKAIATSVLRQQSSLLGDILEQLIASFSDNDEKKNTGAKDKVSKYAGFKDEIQNNLNTTLQLASKSLSSAQSNFFQLKRNIQVTVPKQYTAQINQQAVVFEVKAVIGDGDCGYTAFGITRLQAYQLLIDHLNDIRHLINPALQEALRTRAFVDTLQSKGQLTQALSNAYDDYLDASHGREMPQQVLDALDRAGEDLTILLAYIKYDVKAKQIDNGWSHPCILFALAEIQGIELHIWQCNEQEELVPHSCYPKHMPAQSTSRTDLLFINNNHFERLEWIDKVQLSAQPSNTNSL